MLLAAARVAGRRRAVSSTVSRRRFASTTVSQSVWQQTDSKQQRRKGRLGGAAVSLEADSNSAWGSNLRGLGHNNYLGKILNARVYDITAETPLTPAPLLSSRLANSVLIKREDLHPVFSFKIRGAYNKIAQLSREQLAAGVVACSAGNHAQGVALSATHLGTDAVIVMPTGTPSIKVEAVRKFRGTVKLHGASYDEAQAEAMRLVETEGRTLIHPFDDPDVIAGQGTIGAEILRQMTGKPLDAIFVCCGGGGMLAGIATYVKRVRPDVMIVGVEAEDAAGMTTSLRNGKRSTLDSVGIRTATLQPKTNTDYTRREQPAHHFCCCSRAPEALSMRALRESAGRAACCGQASLPTAPRSRRSALRRSASATSWWTT